MADTPFANRVLGPQVVGPGSPNPAKVSGEDQALFRRVLWIAAAILSVLIVWEVLFQVLIVPSLRIERLSIGGDLQMSEREFLDIIGIEERPLYFMLHEQDVRARLESIPNVKKAEVTKSFPDSLRVVLSARHALVQSLVQEDQSIVLIDDAGVAFERVPKKVAYDLPVLTGVEFRSFQPGTRLPNFLLPFLRDLSELQSKHPALFQAFSEFRLVPLGNQDLEVLVYAVEHSVPVRINPRFDAQAATYVLRTMQMLSGSQGFSGVREVDFRARDIILKKGDE